MDDYIEYENYAISSCCGVPIYADVGICSECKEHCEAEFVEPDTI